MCGICVLGSKTLKVLPDLLGRELFVRHFPRLGRRAFIQRRCGAAAALRSIHGNSWMHGHREWDSLKMRQKGVCRTSVDLSRCSKGSQVPESVDRMIEHQWQAWLAGSMAHFLAMPAQSPANGMPPGCNTSLCGRKARPAQTSQEDFSCTRYTSWGDGEALPCAKNSHWHCLSVRQGFQLLNPRNVC